MARKSKTQAVFKVSMMLPQGATLQQAQAFVSKALSLHRDLDNAGSVMNELDKEKIKVSLDSRHTYY